MKKENYYSAEFYNFLSIEIIKNNRKPDDIYPEVKRRGYKGTFKAFKDICFELKKEKEVKKYCERESNEEKKNLEERNITFGVASDFHFGSKACQITALNEFGEECRKRGVNVVLVPGDLLAGYGVYKGQGEDLYTRYSKSSEEQENSLMGNLPLGFNWYVIGGNHDESFIKYGSKNPLETISEVRKDIHYLGMGESSVQILKNIKLAMWHPNGKISKNGKFSRLTEYIGDKAMIEYNMLSKENDFHGFLRFALCGHYHIQGQFMVSDIMGLLCGSFEGRTQYLKSLSIYPNIGGYIIDVELRKDNSLKTHVVKFCQYPDIENDYKNYKHTYDRKKKIKTIDSPLIK